MRDGFDTVHLVSRKDGAVSRAARAFVLIQAYAAAAGTGRILPADSPDARVTLYAPLRSMYAAYEGAFLPSVRFWSASGADDRSRGRSMRLARSE